MTRVCACWFVIVAACSGTTEVVLSDAGIATQHTVSKIWVSGSWPGSNGARVGGLAVDAMLPAVPTTPLPDDPHNPVQTLRATSSNNVVDISDDGSEMVFVAVDASHNSNLYSANGDGTGAKAIFSTTAVISDLSISPDGSMLVFAADIESPGMFDLYLMVLGQDDPVVTKLSKDRAANDPALSVAPGAVWSQTSRWIAYAAATTEADYNEVYVIDIRLGVLPIHRSTVLSRDQILVPEAATGPKGETGPLVFDGTNNLWYAARVAASASAPVELFQAFAPAPDLQAPISVPLPARSDSTTASVGSIAIAPDRLHLAYAADAPTASAFEIYYTSIDMPAVRTQLTTSTVAPGGGPLAGSPMWFSPDGAHLALVGDLDGAGAVGPYVVDAIGGQRRLVTVDAAHRARELAWNGPSTLYCVGALAADHSQLFELDPTAAAQTPVLAVDGEISDVDIDP